MSDLKEQLIRLGSEKPELKENLIPVLSYIEKRSSANIPSLKKRFTEMARVYEEDLAEGIAKEMKAKFSTKATDNSVTVFADESKEDATEFSFRVKLVNDFPVVRIMVWRWSERGQHDEIHHSSPRKILKYVKANCEWMKSF